MRLNKFIASSIGVSRRKADEYILAGRVTINQKRSSVGSAVLETDEVRLDGKPLRQKALKTILLNKPSGFVCSRRGQGSKTIYNLLPRELSHLKPVGRLDKDSTGLLLLTNDGDLANRLTHPRYQKEKTYEVKLDRELTEADFRKITGRGIRLEDGPSKLKLDSINKQNYEWKVMLSEGRNRQIRRTFAALNYRVERLHRSNFGEFELSEIQEGTYKLIS